MHTRIYGQGFVIALLLGLMGVKGYLDSMGQYITEAEANARVEDMRQMRLQLKERLARDRRLMEERERVLRGKKENSEEHQTRERQLQNVDDFEAQMEQEQEVGSGDDRPKSKKSKKKKKISPGGMCVTVETDTLPKKKCFPVGPQDRHTHKHTHTYGHGHTHTHTSTSAHTHNTHAHTTTNGLA